MSELVQGWIDDARMVGIVGDVREKLECRIDSWARLLLADNLTEVPLSQTPEMIDRMAQAMYAAKYPKQAIFYRAGSEKTREEYRKMVRAALDVRRMKGDTG